MKLKKRKNCFLLKIGYFWYKKEVDFLYVFAYNNIKKSVFRNWFLVDNERACVFYTCKPLDLWRVCMLRGMVFIDHMNFDIALQKYYKSLNKPTIKLDYNKLFRNVCAQISNVDFLKGFIFVPKPDEFLMKDKYLENYYNWVTGMKNAPYTDVIEGRYVARPVDENIPMEIDNKSTYYKVEKGTDINLAAHAISKAFYNSYDIAFFLSADTDYIKVYEVLKSIGKITVVVGVKGQNINSIRPMVDNVLILNEEFFDNCKRDVVVRR